MIPAPNTYEGSFAEADMNKFRPVPAPNPAEDPWYVLFIWERSLILLTSWLLPF